VKAVVIDRPHAIGYLDVDEPRCGPGDVVVRSHSVGVCRTDLEVLHGELDPRWVRYPCIPGHEWSGTVEEVGADVAGVSRGDRVVCEGLVPCNRCARCRAGETNLCERGEHLGLTRAGALGELVLVPEHVVHRLPDESSFTAAVLVEPGSVVLRALERGRAAPGESLGVIGVGTIGSLAIILGRLLSPREIVAYGVRPEELELARSLGADHVVDLTAGEPAGGHDLVIESAGALAAFDLATRLPREGGRVVVLGIAGRDRTVELPPDRLTLRDVELIGSVSYTSAVWSRMVGLLAAGLVDLEPLVTHRFPIAHYEEAFGLLEHRTGRVAKIVLDHAA
jgi:threonine dehydrogenase-like Zn-dependent dehydrogenase